MRIFATDKSLLVQFKQKGVFYGTASVEGGEGGNEAAHPFDEVNLAPGQSFDLPEGGTLIAARELGLGSSPEFTEAGDNASGE